MSSSDFLFTQPLPNQTLPDFLASTEERWNKRIDKEVGNLGGGLQKIVRELESGVNSDKHTSAVSTLSVQTTTASLISSAESLLVIAHQLKLWALLSAEEERDKGVQEEIEWTKKQVEELREEAKKLVGEIGGAKAE